LKNPISVRGVSNRKVRTSYSLFPVTMSPPPPR
jgi:hypothetical protein